MDREKEGTLTPNAQQAIGDAARANVNAAVEVAKSAVDSFVGALAREQKKPSRRKKGANTGSTRKKAASRGTASKGKKSARSPGGRRSTAASGRKAEAKRQPITRRTGSAAATRETTRKAASKPTRKSSQAKRNTKARARSTKGATRS